MEHSQRAPDRPPADTCDRDELNRAIVDDELVLYYQPTVNLANGSVTGFEALVRWPHPRLGLLPASGVVPAAERWNLIEALDEWVLTTAVSQLAAWQEDVIVVPGFRMAVNVSGDEVDGDHLVDRVRHVINASGVDARGLVIEITETCRIKDPAAARRSAEGLHGLGVELALDDFGSQHSTFSRLNDLPFDVLKIDREFVVVCDTKVGQGFIRALIELGDGLGARIIAEGIETCEQAAQLRALGAHEGQGFFWSPALSADEATALLATGVWPPRDVETAWFPRLA